MIIGIDLEQALLVISVILGAATIFVMIKKTFKNQIASIVKELQTGNGSSIAHYVVKTSNKLDEVAGLSRDNRTLIEEHGRQIREVRDELIRHQVEGHQTDQ